MLVTFWDSLEIILAYFMQKGQTVQNNCENKPKRKTENNASQAGQEKKVIILHNNAPSYTALYTVERIRSFKWQLLSHSPYSPDLSLRLLFVSRTEKKARWKQIWDQDGLDFICKSVPQQYVYFMVCRGNTKAPTKVTKVYRRRWGIL